MRRGYSCDSIFCEILAYFDLSKKKKKKNPHCDEVIVFTARLRVGGTMERVCKEFRK